MRAACPTLDTSAGAEAGQWTLHALGVGSAEQLDISQKARFRAEVLDCRAEWLTAE